MSCLSCLVPSLTHATALVQSIPITVSSSLSPSALDVASNPDISPSSSFSTSISAVLRPTPSRKSSMGPAISPSGDAYVDDSIASIDMSDLTALKSDNEADGDVADFQSFSTLPPVPQLPRSHPMETATGRPLYTHTPRKPSRASISSVHVFPTSSAEVSTTRNRVGDNNNYGDYGAHHDRETRGGVQPQSRSSSPEIPHIISLTPRPRKRSTSARSRTRTPSLGRERKPSVRSRKGSDAVPPLPKLSPSRMRSAAELGRHGAVASEETEGVDDEAHDSDSSLDLHTPLP